MLFKKNVVAFTDYTHIPKLRHGYSQVTGEDGIKLGWKGVEDTQPVGAIEGSTVILPWLRSAVTINTLPDGKRHFARLHSLLQLTNVIAGFSLTLLFLVVSAGS